MAIIISENFKKKLQHLYMLSIFCFMFFTLHHISYAQWKATNYPSHTPWVSGKTANGNLLVANYTEPLEVSLSTDKGNSFTVISELSGITYTSFCQVDQTSFLGGFGGTIARSQDNGLTWETFDFSSVFAPGTEITDCYGLEFFNGKLFAAGFGAGVAYSEDMGETWKSTDVASLTTSIDGPYVYGLKAYKGTLYAFAVRAIFKYDEAENKWVYITESLYPTSPIIHNGELYVGHAAPNGPFFIRKTSDGENWVEIEAPEAVQTNEARVLASYNNVLYAGSSRNGIFYSLDGGNTWEDFSDGYPNSYANEYATPLSFTFIDDFIYVTGFDFVNGGVFKRKAYSSEAGLEDISDIQKPKIDFDPRRNTLDIYGDYTIAQMEIYNTQGQFIYQKRLNADKTISLEQLSSGGYLYRIDFGQDYIITGKFVK